MIRILTALCLSSLAIAGSAANALAADRLTDKEVKDLIQRIEQEEERFENALDDKFKRSVMRGPNGEVDVDRYLEDFAKRIDTLKDRFKPEFAAGVEAQDLLRQGSAIGAFFRSRGAGMKGESEWTRLSESLGSLAQAYSTTFPLPDGGAAKRMNDREVASLAKDVASRSEQMKRAVETALKKDKTVDQATREGITGRIDQLTKSAKTLESRLNDGQPSSAEAQALVRQVQQIKATIAERKLEGAAGANWSTIAARTQTLAQAYGVPVDATANGGERP